MNTERSIETDRLRLRPPRAEDAESIFQRYAGDAEVCRYLAWPRHETIDDTLEFIAFSDAEWSRTPAGPFLVFEKQGGALVGSTGLSFESETCASTGYVFARDAWGKGYATETVRAMVALAVETGVERLYAHCHPDHFASQHVLEKAGLRRESGPEHLFEFPNLERGRKIAVPTFACRPADT